MNKILLFILPFFINGCWLWTTDAPKDMQSEHESVFNSLNKACDKGNAISCSNLAYLYSEGKVVEKNTKKALFYYQKACTNGVLEACESMKSIEN